MSAQSTDAFRVVRKLALLVAPMLSIVALVNYFVDPGELFYRRAQRRNFVDWIAAGHNVRTLDVPSNWAGVELELVRTLTPRDVTVWGTSRSSELSRADFSNRSFFNYVMPGGSVLDYVALFEAHKLRGALPHTVILSIDPWSFCARQAADEARKDYVPSPHTPLTPAIDVEPEFRRGMSDLGLTPPPPTPFSYAALFDRWSTLISLSYFQAALHGIPQRRPEPTELAAEPGHLVVRSDGSYTLAPDPSTIDPSRVAAEARAFAAAAMSVSGLLDERVLVPQNVEVFERLIAELRRQHVRVVLFLAPLHPDLYDAVTASRPNAVEPMLKTLAAKYEVPIIGSFDPHRYGFDATHPWFIDEYHPSRKAIDVILAAHAAAITETTGTPR